MAERTPVSRASLVQQLAAVGVRPGGVLQAHTSYRGIGPVERGPMGLIEALRDALGPEGTLVMPSWGGRDDVPFHRERDPPAEDLGVLPRLFWTLPETLRSDHLHAFAAAGPRAADILRDRLPLPPHRPESPVERVRDLEGQVLLLGGDHEADTTAHLAEVTAGVRYGRPKHVTVLESGSPVRIDCLENDHCCERFRLVDGWLRAEGVQTEGPVGHGIAKLADARAIVGCVVERLVFLHPPEVGCRQCDEARASLGHGVDLHPPVHRESR